jgi:hypothetical protein
MRAASKCVLARPPERVILSSLMPIDTTALQMALLGYEA